MIYWWCLLLILLPLLASGTAHTIIRGEVTIRPHLVKLKDLVRNSTSNIHGARNVVASYYYNCHNCSTFYIYSITRHNECRTTDVAAPDAAAAAGGGPLAHLDMDGELSVWAATLTKK